MIREMEKGIGVMFRKLYSRIGEKELQPLRQYVQNMMIVIKDIYQTVIM
jgi:hypothetical protein